MQKGTAKPLKPLMMTWLLLLSATLTAVFPFAVLAWPAVLATIWARGKQTLAVLALILLCVSFGMMYDHPLLAGMMLLWVALPAVALIFSMQKQKGLLDSTLYTVGAMLLSFVGTYFIISLTVSPDVPTFFAQQFGEMVKALPKDDSLNAMLSYNARMLDLQANPAATEAQAAAIKNAPIITDRAELTAMLVPAFAKVLKQVLPSMLMTIAAVWGFLSAYIAKRKFAKSAEENAIANEYTQRQNACPPFELLFIPKSLANTLVFVLMITLIAGYAITDVAFLQVAFYTSFTLISVVFAMAGLSAGWFYAKRTRIPFALYVLLGLVMFVLLPDIPVFMGLFDHVFNIRKRKMKMDNQQKGQDET